MLRLLATFLVTFTGTTLAAPMIVQDGKPNAEIIIAAENRPRVATLAALELQYFIEKMSGARLPIVTAATGKAPVKVFVGRSPGTDALGVTDEGLKYGAFKMVSGPDWLVLLGDDFDFTPPSYMPVERDDPKPYEEWNKSIKGKTKTSWGFPFGAGFKRKWAPSDFIPLLDSRYGEGSGKLWTSGGNSFKGMQHEDEAGSLNAVCEFVHGLGARWYMAGPTGEVIPKLASIPLPEVNRTVVPENHVRSYLWYNYSAFGFDDVLWARRMGINSPYQKLGLVGPHGLVNVHRTAEMKAAHPEYYALVAGKRETEHRGHGTPCFSSEGLIKETVDYCRFLFDEYDAPAVDLMPGDGLRLCGCDLCKGQSAPDLVWGFTDKVAKELYKTHPDRTIIAAAYTSYNEPSDKVEKFTPNVVVWISNSGRPMMDEPGHWAEYTQRLDRWKSKLGPGQLMRGENNRYHIAGDMNGIVYFPVIHPRAMAKDFKYLRGFSVGSRGEQSQFRAKWAAPGLDHLTLYLQSRLLWNADQDVEAMMNEYFDLYYGPVAPQMREAINFAEQNYARDNTSGSRGRNNPAHVPLETALKFRELVEKAEKAAPADSVYAERVKMISSALQPKEKIIAEHSKVKTQEAAARAKAPSATGVEGGDLTKATVYRLKDNKTGNEPTAETTFRVGWEKNTLILEIVCKDPDMATLDGRSTDTVWDGDHVAIALETGNHSFYKIEINPKGMVAEGDPDTGWKSLSEVVTDRGPDFWKATVRIPVVGDLEAHADPLHRVAGAMPTAKDPWSFNVGRARKHKEGVEHQTFSPSLGEKGAWYSVNHFGKIEIKPGGTP